MRYGMIHIESWDHRTRRMVALDAMTALAGIAMPDGMKVHGGPLDSETGESAGEIDTTLVVGILDGFTIHDAHDALRNALQAARPRTSALLPDGMENATVDELWHWYFS